MAECGLKPMPTKGGRKMNKAGLEQPSRRCENCGLPSWAVSGPGVSITIEDRPENRFQRARKRTAWCHNQECAVQALAVSKYGRASNNWPMTLAQFRSMRP